MAETKTTNKRKKGRPVYSCMHSKMTVIADQTTETIKEIAAEGFDSTARVKTESAWGFIKTKQVVKTNTAKTVKPMHAGKEQPWVHIDIRNAKRNLWNTYHHVDDTYLQCQLDEVSHKLNRRYMGDKLFERLIIARISFAANLVHQLRILLGFSIFIFVIACQRNERSTTSIDYCSTIKANPTDTSGFKLSDLSKKKDFIFLETCDSGLISRIQKLIQVNGCYYLMTSTNRGQIFIFSPSGKFINKIGRIGKGPGEYTELIDFSVDLSNRHVYLLTSTKKIIHLDDKLKWIEDIQLKKVPCPYDLHRVAVFRDHLFFRAYTQQNFSLLITDKGGHFKKF